MKNIYEIYSAKKSKKCQDSYAEYRTILSKRHPSLKSIIKSIGPLQYRMPIWKSLEDAVLYAVVGQMLSVHAAGCIISKLLNRFKSSHNTIRWASRSYKKLGPLYGLSQRKRRALYEWGRFMHRENRTFLSEWIKIPLKDYRDNVSSVWGFGTWAADMIAIFYLGRMDVWPESDKGIQRACEIIFKNKEKKVVYRYIKGCETVIILPKFHTSG